MMRSLTSSCRPHLHDHRQRQLKAQPPKMPCLLPCLPG